MTLAPGFFRLTAGASFVATLGVLVAQLGLTGYPSPTTLAESVGLYAHPVFRAQGWVIFAQVLLMFVGLWGCTLKAYRQAPELILTGFLFFILWQVLEIVPRSIEMSTMSYGWAPAFIEAQDQEVQDQVSSAMEQTGAILAGIGVGRRIVWALGHLMFGLAFWRGAMTMRVLGVLFLLNFLRLFLRFGGEVSGWTWLSGLSGGTWGFVVTMVPLFGLIGWWLWTDPRQLGLSPARP